MSRGVRAVTHTTRTALQNGSRLEARARWITASGSMLSGVQRLEEMVYTTDEKKGRKKTKGNLEIACGQEKQSPHINHNCIYTHIRYFKQYNAHAWARLGARSIAYYGSVNISSTFEKVIFFKLILRVFLL